MSGLDVALRLRLINQLSGPAKEAKRDLDQIAGTAKKLDGAKADKLARDLGKTKVEAKAADAALQKTAVGAKKLETAKADRLARDLGKTKVEAERGQRALAQMQRTLRQLDGAHAERLVSGLRNATAASERLARALKRVREEARAAHVPIGSGGAHAPDDGGHGGSGGTTFLGLGARTIGVAGVAYGGYRAATAVGQKYTDFAALDRRMTRVGITADASKPEVESATANVRAWAQKYAMPVEQVLLGLEDLVTQGRELPVAEAMLGPIVQAAQASGAAVQDMAGTSGAMLTNLKITADQLPEAFDKLAYAGKKGQFELKAMAHYFPELGAVWARAGQEGIDRLADLAAALQTVRKQTGNDEKTFAGIRDLLTKIDTTNTQNNFKKMGIDLAKELKKAKKEGRSLFDTLIELTERATKGDRSLLPKLFTENESLTAINALISLKQEFRSLRAEINTKSAGTISTDIVRVTDDAQASIDRLANAWSAAGVALGKYVAESTPAIAVLEAIAKRTDEVRLSIAEKGYWETLKDTVKDMPRFWGDLLFGKKAAAGAQPPAPTTPPSGEIDAWLQFKEAAARNFSLVPPKAADQAEGTMQRITQAISAEGANAITAAQAIADRIKAIFNFTAEPTIAPRLGGSRPQPPAPAAPATPGKGASVNRPVKVVINVNGAGKDGGQIGKEIGRQLAQLGNANSALFDIG